MKVAVLQTDIAWQHPADNYRRVEQMLSSISGESLCLLPEMWTTGFVVEPDGVAEMEGPTLEWMKTKAKEYGTALCGTVAVCHADEGSDAGRKYFNRMYFVEPGGKVWHYDKRHLFGMGGEKTSYTAGNERVVVAYRGWRFLLLTCYDLRFPIWSRNRGDYDAILIAANWPASRRKVWDILLKARAIENQCYVVAAGRVGSDPQARYDGGSCIINPKGQLLAGAEDGKEQAITAKIDAEAKQKFIHRFNTLEDADAFSLL